MSYLLEETMDFDQAIKVHQAWKDKLANYIKKPDGSIKGVDVCLDKRCDLGKWIFGEGGKYSNLEEYKELKKVHNAFHRAASEVVNMADTKRHSVEAMIGEHSDFTKASKAVIAAIKAVQEKANI